MMMSTVHMLLLLAEGFYGLSLVCAFLVQRRPVVTRIFLVPALAANTAAVAIRYHLAWPMLPMYLSTAAVPAFLGVLFFFVGLYSAIVGFRFALPNLRILNTDHRTSITDYQM